MLSPETGPLNSILGLLGGVCVRVCAYTVHLKAVDDTQAVIYDMQDFQE